MQGMRMRLQQLLQPNMRREVLPALEEEDRGAVPEENMLGKLQRAVLPISNKGAETEDGRAGLPIGKEEIGKAREQFEKYRSAKMRMDKRIAENEDWWRGQHLPYVRKEQNREGDTTSAWLFNSIESKHADAMDNIPAPSVLPRESSDRQTAEALSSVLPVVLEQCDFENVWDKCWRYKLKMGMSCYGVFWDSDKLHGLGDVEIAKVDILNLFWEYGIHDIQDSRNVFYVSQIDTDLLEQEYPELKGKLGERKDTVRYNYDTQTEANEKSAVIEWYYKRKAQDGRTVVHYCKFVGDQVLYATENDPEAAERGLYDHGMYPFVLDPLFELEGTLEAFGYVDVMKGVQTRIDRLMNAITDNAQRSARKRYFKRDSAGVNEEEFRDLTKDIVHVTDGGIDDNNLREIKTDALPGSVLTVLNNYIEELKETSGNRDVSNGGVSGVTSASGLAAQMEASGKLSRDMIKGGYRAFKQVCDMVLELMRQFYTEERYFRITGPNGGAQYMPFSNAGMRDQQVVMGQEIMTRKPIFDVVVKAQKASPYSKMAQNEMVKEFYSLGFFNPQQADMSLAALRMMDFDGKDEIIKTVEQNGTMYNMLNTLQSLVVQMTAMIDPTGQQGILNRLQQQGLLNVPGQQMMRLDAGNAASGDIITNSLGAPMGKNNLVERAKMNAQETTAPR